MVLYETFVEGNSKRIYSASPLQVLLLRKQYLVSKSPGKVPEVLKPPMKLPRIIAALQEKAKKNFKYIASIGHARKRVSLAFHYELVHKRVIFVIKLHIKTRGKGNYSLYLHI